MRQLSIIPSLLCTAGLALACGCSAQVDAPIQATARAVVPAESSPAARPASHAPPPGKPITAATLDPSRILAASYLEDTQRGDSHAAAPAPVVSRPVVSSAVALNVPASTSAPPARFDAPLDRTQSDRTQQPSTIRLAMRPAPAADAPAPRPPVVERASAANAPPVVAGPAAPLRASTVASDVDPSVIPADVAAEQTVQPVDRVAGRHARRESRSDAQPAASAGRPSPSALPDPPAVVPSNRRVGGDPLDVPLVERPVAPRAAVSEMPGDRSVLVRGRRTAPMAKAPRANPPRVTSEAPATTVPPTSGPAAESPRQSKRVESTRTESAAPPTNPASRTKQTEPTVVGRLKLSSVAPPPPARAPQSIVAPPPAAMSAPRQAAAPVLRSATPLAWTNESPQLTAPRHFERPAQPAPPAAPAAPVMQSVLVPRSVEVSKATAANVVPATASTVTAAPVKAAPVAAAPAYVAPVYVARPKVAKSSVVPPAAIVPPVTASPVMATAPVVAPPVAAAPPVALPPVAAPAAATPPVVTQSIAPQAAAAPSVPAPSASVPAVSASTSAAPPIAAPGVATDSGWIRARSATAPLPIVLATTPARTPVEPPPSSLQPQASSLDRQPARYAPPSYVAPSYVAAVPTYQRQRAASIAAAAPAVTSPVAMASVQSSANPADVAAADSTPTDSTSVAVPQRAVRGPSIPDPAEPQRSSTVSAVNHRVRQQVRYAFSLAGRGAVYSARVELIEALKLVALAQDADEGTSQHSQAVAAALMALREADDFATNDSQVNMQCDVARIVATHETPVLKGRVQSGTTALNALQDYYAYAQQQLAVAGGREVSASMILYGLGRVYTAINNRQTMCGPKAIALFQAALSVDPRNYLAANEQGVLLARYGQLDESEALLQHSARVSPQPETWQNLATVHRLRGQADMAAFDQQNAQELIAARRTGTASNRATAALVDWVDPGVFLAANEAPPPPSHTASIAGEKSTGPSGTAATTTSRAKSAASNVPNVAKPAGATSPWYVPQAIRDLTARSHDNTTTR